MIDFILAGLIYLGVMFVVAFCISFVTIAIACTAAAALKYCCQWFRQPGCALPTVPRS